MASGRAMDDPRLLDSRPFRAVHFVFGLVGAGAARPIPATALVRALGALGITPVAARGTLLRLRRSGALASRRASGRAIYELTPASRRLMDEVVRRIGEDPPPWDGVFRVALLEVPEDARAFREVLKRRARYAGFGVLRPGLLIAPYEASWAAIAPDAAGDGSWVKRAELRLSPSDARSAAREVWQIPALAKAMRAECARMDRAAARTKQPRDGRSALTELWNTVAPFFQRFAAQPPLPSELLPSDWPIGDARRSFARVTELLAPPAIAYMNELIEGGNIGVRR